jgi:hypothetical protein
MTSNEIATDHFGCDHCWPVEAEAAWSATCKLMRDTELIDESHFHILIVKCNQCAQRFISVFTEMIDWENGNDPQYRILLPITDFEAVSLIQNRDSISEDVINALGKGRKSLRRDFPKDAASPYTYWGSGIFVGPHD